MKRTILLAVASLFLGACAGRTDETVSSTRGTNDVRRVDTSTTGSTVMGRTGGVYDPSVIGHPADSGLALDSGNLPRTAEVGVAWDRKSSVGTSSGAKKKAKKAKKTRHHVGHAKDARF